MPLALTHCFIEKVVASGTPVIQEPTDQPHGVRVCAVRDPSGNMVRLTQPVTGWPLVSLATRLRPVPFADPMCRELAKGARDGG